MCISLTSASAVVATRLAPSTKVRTNQIETPFIFPSPLRITPPAYRRIHRIGQKRPAAIQLLVSLPATDDELLGPISRNNCARTKRVQAPCVRLQALVI